ncbi:class I SAM-dependent methyltransferase [Bacillus testis]|uniref:class I SAM-dependent methyltransferase n=1 Tax=Bacillus testis TaxID=1622072 RepID=UPI00067F1DF2|nr:class I SAM-dependent methyltransferase [Bacillus testis]
MKQNESSMTSLISSFSRAYHSENDTPVIFDDYLAKELISAEEYNQIKQFMVNGFSFFAPELAGEMKTNDDKLRWIVQTQLAPTPLARAAYTERVILNEKTLGLKQYVILGAGMDTFAFRKGEGLSIFEVDHPNTQQFKLSRIQKAGWEMPSNLKMAAVDFQKDNLQEALLQAGFDPKAKTVFSLLGVSYYLNKEEFKKLLGHLEELMIEGSSIIFDYADEELFQSDVKRVQNMVAMAKQSGESMKSVFSIKELERMLQDSSLLIYEHLSPELIQEAFFSDRKDDLSAFEHIHYVHAVYK